MISQRFEISNREAEKRISSTIQHKLRVVMKCYTITDFNIDDLNNSFNFKKTHKIRGILFKDSKIYIGNYLLEKKENPI